MKSAVYYKVYPPPPERVRFTAIKSLGSPRNLEEAGRETRRSSEVEQMAAFLLAVALLTPSQRPSAAAAAWTHPKERSAQRSKLRLYSRRRRWRARGEVLKGERRGDGKS